MSNTVKDKMNSWGREFLRTYSWEVADDADISFEDDIEYNGFCETCYSEDYVVRVSDGVNVGTYYGSIISLLADMAEEADND